MNMQLERSFPNLKAIAKALESEPETGYSTGFTKTFQTNELYSLDVLITLLDYYSDLNILEPENARIRKGYLLLKTLVEENTEAVPFRLKDNYYVREVDYGFNNPYEIGRIYNTQLITAQSLQREMRFFLFKNEYTDVDLVNSHPSILYRFAQQNNVQTPALKRLVENRTMFYQEMSESRLIEGSSKKCTLITLNLIDSDKHKEILKNLPENCQSLYSDIELVREKLFEKLFESDEKVFTSLKGFLMNKHSNINDSMEMRRSVQIYYCFTQESLSLTLLRRRIMDRVPDLSTISFLPIFDGALIRTGDSFYQSDLTETLVSVNEEIYPLTFKESPLTLEQGLLTEETFKCYLNINHFLGQSHTISNFETLLTRLEMEPFELSETAGFSIVNSESDYFLDDPKIQSEIDLETRKYHCNFRLKLLDHAQDIDSLENLLHTSQ